jgi:signal transduction histidine kinase
MRHAGGVLARCATASRERAVDAVACAGLTIFMVAVNGHLRPPVDGRGIGPFAYALTVTAGVAMMWCRHRPRVAFGVVMVALGCYVGRGYPNGPVLATGWLALLALSLRADRRSALTGGVALCVVLGVAGFVRGGITPLPLFFVGWSAAAVFLGDALRNRRAYLRELEERVRDAERTREEEARRRVAEDRLRIARDLHDSVAHAMATINVQAGAAAHVVDRRPEAAKTAFVAIQRASGEVLDELTGMLRLLRDAGAADRAPVPKIDQIVHLVEATRDSGLRVRLRVDGPTETMPGSVATAAYRIVQESLTNVIRHAGAENAWVTAVVGPGRDLLVEVRDDGTAACGETTGTGVGIAGMRERAESTGGRLRAGPMPSGGFVVRATWEGRP